MPFVRETAIVGGKEIIIETGKWAKQAGGSVVVRCGDSMVLVTAAHWRADYEFSVHIPEARKAGLSEETIAAIRDGRVPQLDDPDSKLIYDFATTFYANREVPDALFNEAVARFGRQRVVEFVGVLGYYSMLAVFMRVFRVEGLDGFRFR